jgi:lipoprotein NlpI
VGDLDGALADFNKAVELDPGTAVFYRLRGGIKEAKGDLDGAIVDFRRTLELKPTAQDYMRIGVWIARTKKGEKSAANDELAGYLGKRTPDADGDWPAKIARFLMGQISEADLLAEAKSSDAEKDKGRHCEFWYYAGMKQLFAGDKKSAADDFRKSVATQEKRFGEYWSAKSELKALGE